MVCYKWFLFFCFSFENETAVDDSVLPSVEFNKTFINKPILVEIRELKEWLNGIDADH